MPGMGKAKRIGGCTVSGGGLYRWYKGKTRYVCPHREGMDNGEAEDAWVELRKRIDRGQDGRVASASTLRQLISDFIIAARHRVATGKPKPLSPRTLQNYIADLNQFGECVGGGLRVGDVGPQHFAAYAGKISHLKRSGYDSKVAHVRTLFSWAKENEYIDRPRYGTAFSRPGKQAIRDERVVTRKSFSAAEVAKLIDASTGTLRVMLMLGVCAAMNNSEVAGLERACVDLDTGIIDFRRRKTGRVRRVIPLPPDVAAELRVYVRPVPRNPTDEGLFFLTEEGNPYVRITKGGQANTITVLFRRLAEAAGVKTLAKGETDGRGFAGMRTTFCNLAPPGYREEVELLTGHAMGTVLLDHYVERVGMERLRHVVDVVWGQVQSLLNPPIPSVPSTPSIQTA